MPSNWEQIDQRFVFFTVQLASTETSLNAVNKALKVAGYHQTAQQQQAAIHQQANANMDRNGGGPVPWDQFYGKTASQFYRSTDFAAVSVSGHTALAVTSHTDSGIRPPQFDYIYRANQDAQQHAEDEVAKLGGQIDAAQLNAASNSKPNRQRAGRRSLFKASLRSISIPSRSIASR